MNDLLLHIRRNDRYLCNKSTPDEIWPDEFLKDEKALGLDICPDCISSYVRHYGQERWDELQQRLKGKEKLMDNYCPCGHHPEQPKMRMIGLDTKMDIKETLQEEEVDTPTMNRALKTLRMYLNT